MPSRTITLACKPKKKEPPKGGAHYVIKGRRHARKDVELVKALKRYSELCFPEGGKVCLLEGSITITARKP
jgi:hypothetical protein